MVFFLQQNSSANVTGMKEIYVKQIKPKLTDLCSVPAAIPTRLVQCGCVYCCPWSCWRFKDKGRLMQGGQQEAQVNNVSQLPAEVKDFVFVSGSGRSVVPRSIPLVWLLPKSSSLMSRRVKESRENVILICWTVLMQFENMKVEEAQKTFSNCKILEHFCDVLERRCFIQWTERLGIHLLMLCALDQDLDMSSQMAAASVGGAGYSSSLFCSHVSVVLYNLSASLRESCTLCSGLILDSIIKIHGMPL